MNNTIKIKTDINKDKFLKVKLENSFTNLQLLSLNITQEEVYTKYNADYGVIVGRVFMNGGVGCPNAKISIFIPLADNESDIVNNNYPYTSISTKKDNLRYNLLTQEPQNDCHNPVGNFLSKNEILDNDELTEIFDKYYKFSTTTNKSGDFMIFGVPVGTHIMNVDVDLSDIGIFSQRPYDFINQGYPKKLFDSPTKFKAETNLNSLSQIRHQEIAINVIPFWGENNENEIGITRSDVDLNFSLKPSAIFIGSLFGDNEKNSVNKNCVPRKNLGRLCETTSGEGTIEMIRKTLDNEIESFDIDGGRVIDGNGTWAYQIPMNLDYVVTNEYGDLIPTENPNKGIPTRTSVRFKISMDESGGEGRLRSRGKYLVPNNPRTYNDQDFSFNEDTKDENFRDLYWNKIYTVKNHIARVQKRCDGDFCADNRRMVGIKDVDDCVGTKNPFPFNKLDGDFNPLFLVICVILGIIIELLSAINFIFATLHNIKIPIINVRPFGSIKCAGLKCGNEEFRPGCYGDALDGLSSDGDRLHECYKIQIAEALNVYEFDFYNDWVNGSLYYFLFKYKKNKTNEKYCGIDNSENYYLVDVIPDGSGSLTDHTDDILYFGLIKKYDDEYFYSAISKNGDYLLYPTDIYNLGSVFDCDWQSVPSIHNLIPSTTYQIPPFNIGDEQGVTSIANDGNPDDGLMFNLTCLRLSSNSTQIDNIKRICEIGMGLDENRIDNNVIVTSDERLTDNDIENQYIRDILIYLNNNLPSTTVFPLSSGVDSPNNLNYIAYRNLSKIKPVKQFLGDSFYFYFGSETNNTAINKMNSKYFTKCDINQKSDLVISANIINVSNINGNDGSITVQVLGGIAPYQYIWSGGYTTSSLTNLTSGEYYLTVVDFYGNRKSKRISVLEPYALFCNFKTTDVVGLTKGSLNILSIFGGNGPYKIELLSSNGNLLYNNPTLPMTINNLIVGSYSLKVTDSSTTPQILIQNVDILLTPPVTAVIKFYSTNCFKYNESNIVITISGGVPPYLSVTTKTNSNYQSNKLNQHDLEPGQYIVNITDSVGQNYTDTGILDPPFYIVMANIPILHPYRVRLYGFKPNTVYDFYKNSILIGQSQSFYNQPIYFGYDTLQVGDKLHCEDQGCPSDEIIITQANLI